jgi:hypothetical protein
MPKYELTGDSIGNLLRGFYNTFGMPDEGPPSEFDVTATIGTGPPQVDLDLLRTALGDAVARRQLSECRTVLEDLASRLTSEELLRELCGIPIPAGQGIEQLSSGVLWFALASSLDNRDVGLPATPLDGNIDLPLPIRVQMTVQGSLVLRLYIALVYMREGALSDLIATSSRAGGQCSTRVKKLLHSDFVRRIRNALSHGSFSPCIAGIVFRDDRGTIIATPGFLNWLCTWLMLIQLQALAAYAGSPRTV